MGVQIHLYDSQKRNLSHVCLALSDCVLVLTLCDALQSSVLGVSAVPG